MQLTVDVFQLAGTLPPAERPGLSTKLQDTAARIPTLIATGHKTGNRTAMMTACHRAIETLGELETLLIIVGQLYPNVPSNDLLDQLEEVQSMTVTLVRRLSEGATTTITKPKSGPRKAIQ